MKADFEGVAGKCTIALVMINDVPAKYIDDRRPWRAPATDVTSYDDIGHAVHGIWQECLIDDHSLGWASVGKCYISALVELESGLLIVILCGQVFPLRLLSWYLARTLRLIKRSLTVFIRL